jgi:hypothetical protein
MQRTVLIYQMGKVASSSLLRSLSTQAGLELIHAHHLDPAYTRELNGLKQSQGWRTTIDPEAVRVLAQRLAAMRALDVITLVREPVGRNLSAYFNNLHLIHGSRDAYRQLSHDELRDGFLHRYPHDIPLQWFDRELRASLGVDVYQHAFAKAEGAITIEEGSTRLLVMRHDLADADKCRQIEGLLGTAGLHMRRDNLAARKPYSQVYRDFIARVQLPATYLERMLDSRYARHFYGDSERAKLSSYWSAKERDPGLSGSE